MGEDRKRLPLDPSWSERYLGGSPEREAELLLGFAEQIRQVQERNRGGAGEPIRRGFHAKLLAGVVNARFMVSEHLREELRAGPFVPGATHPALVRLSNASGIVAADSVRDLRGIAVRVEAGGGRVHDLLLTNAPASHARDARQFMAAAEATAGGRRLAALPLLVRALGLREGLRVAAALRRAARRVSSVATDAFWSRAPFAVGPYAVRFKLQPLAPPPKKPATSREHDFLRHEFVDRLRQGDVRYHLQVLHYVDEEATPIEDGSVAWPERDPPPETVAELLIPRQDLTTGAGPEGERMVEALAFDPWNGSESIRPIGSLNRARRPVYRASARFRSQGS